jgi:beta-lactamase class A
LFQILENCFTFCYNLLSDNLWFSEKNLTIQFESVYERSILKINEDYVMLYYHEGFGCECCVKKRRNHFPSLWKMFEKVLFICSLSIFIGIVISPAQNAYSKKHPKAPQPAISETGISKLYNDIIRDASVTDGTVGVGIFHLETGRELYLNKTERFPMASSVKIPVAVQLMTLVDRGIVRLDSMITIQESDLHPGSGHIKNRIVPGRSLSVLYLLEQMLTVSDNSATDIIIRLVGGTAAIDRRMNVIGIEGMSVDRPIYIVLSQCQGIDCFNESEPFSLQLFNEMATKVTAEERLRAHRNYINDTRDTSTPEGMTRLLEKIWCGEVLSSESSQLLLDIMSKAHGNKRIKGLLPPGTKVYHKTGTIRGGLSDVGIIELPNDAGHVVVTVFVKGGRKSIRIAESAMAQIARAAYDYFNRNSQFD